MDKELFLSVHTSPTMKTHIWTRRPWMYLPNMWTLTGSRHMAAGTLFLYNIHKRDGSETVFVSCALSFNTTQACTTSIALFYRIFVLDNVKAEPERKFESSGWGDLKTAVSSQP